MNEGSLENIVIRGITMDSRQVKPGDLFMAVPGCTVDGRDYIEQALQQGAVASVLSDRALVGHVAARFFEQPSQHIPVIGITGTSGKTSISHFIAQILDYCRKTRGSCGLIGTLGIGFLGKLDNSICTTPDAVTLQKTLAHFRSRQAHAVAMEVSSHALDQSRVAGIHFHTAIFTNLTRDHLDYHETMEQYALAKQKLFTEFQPKYSIINLEDKYGQEFVLDKRLYQDNRQVIGYSTNKTGGILEKIFAQDIILDDSGICAQITTPWGEGELQCSLLGRFNLSNLLAAVAAVCLQGVPLEQVLEAVRSIQTVPGRLMRFGGGSEMLLVIIDYAHKPDALEKILIELGAHCRGKVWCVVGCGGDRDRGKRPLMAAIAENLSDVVCFTQDNPRTEDPKQVFDDMLKGLKQPEAAWIEYDRKRAIEISIQKAKPEDIIVIAGKGHEEYQIIGTEKIPYSDQIAVQEALQARARREKS